MAFPLSSFQTSTTTTTSASISLFSLYRYAIFPLFLLSISSPFPASLLKFSLRAVLPCYLPSRSSLRPSSCWPGEQLTKSKAGAPGSGPVSSPATAPSYSQPRSPSLLWPLALAPLSAAPAQPWPCLLALKPALPDSQRFPPTIPLCS